MTSHVINLLELINVHDIIEKQVAKSMHQTAEWGMHDLQVCFTCLKDPFVCDEKGECRIAFKNVCTLFKLCSCLVRMNQICNL